MIQLRWLTRNWKEYHEHGVKFKDERVLQYKNITTVHSQSTSGILGMPVTETIESEWEDVPEESIDIN